MDHEIFEITNEAELSECFDVFKALRPHLEHDRFIRQIQRQQQQSYRVIAIRVDHEIASVAGYRLGEFLAWGKVLYIDDLSTLPRFRGLGCASALMDWLLAHAKSEGCSQLHLDTGHHRHTAHKLYLKKGLNIVSHHLSIGLE